MFDGTLENYKGSEYKIELKDKIMTLRKEFEMLVKINILKCSNQLEWVALIFIMLKKNGTVYFISDFRELNKRINTRPTS